MLDLLLSKNSQDSMFKIDFKSRITIHLLSNIEGNSNFSVVSSKIVVRLYKLKT